MLGLLTVGLEPASGRQGQPQMAPLIRSRQGRGGHGKLRNVDHDAKPDLSSFERFREFARRIRAVPKAAIDKEEAKYQRYRKKQKGLRPEKGALVNNAMAGINRVVT